MKLTFFFAFIIASMNVFAQQAPWAGDYRRAPLEDAPPLPPPVPPPPLPPPPPPAGASLRPSRPPLAELLRAQTTAIQNLSSELHSLEERIRKIEDKAR